MKGKGSFYQFQFPYWGLNGLDFGLITLSNASLDGVRNRNIISRTTIRKLFLPTNYFIEPKLLSNVTYLALSLSIVLGSVWWYVLALDLYMKKMKIRMFPLGMGEPMG